MSQYGVRRLVAINSGKYSFANIDLTKPVHLAAPNNRGKSTLVNSLQFLYIDDFTRMRFGHRSHEDTRRHYFGADRSYLVFECLTPSGNQCMLVRGLSNLKGGQFERYVYDGEFDDADYLDVGEIRLFESVRTRLAGRHLTQVRNTELWQVLAGNLSPDGDKAIPRLNILPIRRREDYLAFREVFVRLLSLANVDARALRQLVIGSHGRHIGERKIDVAAEYKAEFDRAERSEHHLDFIRAVAADIDSGRELRNEIAALTERFMAAAPQAWNNALRCYHLIESDEGALQADMVRLDREQQETAAKKESLLIDQGRFEAALKTAEDELAQLQAAHEKWTAYSAEFIKEMRDKVERQAAEIAERAQHLEMAGKLDLHAMRNRVQELEQQLETDRKAVAHWGKTAAAELRRARISDEELAAAFRVVNPSLLKLIVGDTLTITDLNVTLSRIREIASRVKDNTYSDDALTARLSGVAGPDEMMLLDAERLLKKIAVNEQDLARHTARLQAAEDEANARNALEALRNDYQGLCQELAEFDRYTRAWAGRADVENRVAQAKERVTGTQREIQGLVKTLAAQARDTKRLEAERIALTDTHEKLRRAAREFKQLAQRVALDTVLASESDQATDEAARPKSLLRFTESAAKKIAALTADIERISAGRLRVKELQDSIAAKSSGFETQQRYFSDPDSEWGLLIESRDSLPQLETANAKSWDALFTTLGARLNAVVTAVGSIKTAIEGLNRGLKQYRVSNLRAVQIKLEEEHDTYSAVESLSSQGSLFQDRDAIDLAKKKLRQMIDRNEMIDLESLFELRINIQQSDGTWQESPSLDEIGSTGTGMTAKAMIFIQLVRAIAANEKYRLHFYIDGLGELDDNNLTATAAMAVSKGVIPITADPRLHLEPLAQPEVTVYSLGQDAQGWFYVDSYKTYHAHRRAPVAGDHRD